MSWEDTFRLWGSPPGKTEKGKMGNTENAVKKAIYNDERLSSMDISVFTQGSYKARTNVRQDSDVDVCVRLNCTFFSKYPEGKTCEDYGNIERSISFAEFENLLDQNNSFRFVSITKDDAQRQQTLIPQDRSHSKKTIKKPKMKTKEEIIIPDNLDKLF